MMPSFYLDILVICYLHILISGHKSVPHPAKSRLSFYSKTIFIRIICKQCGTNDFTR